MVIDGLTDDLPIRVAPDGGPVYHDPPHTIRNRYDSLDDVTGVLYRWGSGRTLSPEEVPIYLCRLQHSPAFRNAILTGRTNILPHVGRLPSDRLFFRWSELDLKVYRAAYHNGLSIDLGSDGHLYVQGDNAQQRVLASLDVEDAIPQADEDTDDDSWMADFEPNLRINSTTEIVSIVLVPTDHGCFTPWQEQRLQDDYNAP